MGPDGLTGLWYREIVRDQTTNQAENRIARARAATSGPHVVMGCTSLLHPSFVLLFSSNKTSLQICGRPFDKKKTKLGDISGTLHRGAAEISGRQV
jgi:hypothetical protein